MTLQVIEDIKRCIQDLETEQQMAPINVQLMDSNCAFIYQNSKMAEVNIVFDVEETISCMKQICDAAHWKQSIFLWAFGVTLEYTWPWPWPWPWP